MQENDEEIVEEHDSDHARTSGDDDLESSETGTADKVKKLRGDLKKCQEEKADYLAGWQRAKADFINRERVLKEDAVRLSEYTKERILGDLLPILDGFDMAIAAPGWQTTEPTWRNGIEALQKQLLSALAKHSITPFESEGQPFDPSKHEAVSTMPVHDEAEDHVVKTVLQKGYMAGERVVRPARVVIGELKK